MATNDETVNQQLQDIIDCAKVYRFKVEQSYMCMSGKEECIYRNQDQDKQYICDFDLGVDDD